MRQNGRAGQRVFMVVLRSLNDIVSTMMSLHIHTPPYPHVKLLVEAPKCMYLVLSFR